MNTSILWVIDRIEDGERAVLVREPTGGAATGEAPVDGTIAERQVVALVELPSDVREGDALRELPAVEGTERRFARDLDATVRLRERAEALRAALRRGPSGPLSL